MTTNRENSHDPVRRAQELMRVELPKKFYSEVTIEAENTGFSVKLDGRTVKTPSRNLLMLPTASAAEKIRAEWHAQVDVINPALMPVTRLVNTVIDGVVQNGDAVFEEIVAYAGNDMLFYRAESPRELVDRQTKRWGPILDWAADAYGARFILVQGIVFASQPEDSLAVFSSEMAQYRAPFALGALHVMTTLTGSALLSLALARDHIDLDTAWSLAHLEEDWTSEQWGEDAEAINRRAKRFEDMKAAHDLFLSLEA